MLRRFSFQRIAGFLLFDWCATLLALWLAAVLRAHAGTLPHPINEVLLALEIQYAHWRNVDWQLILQEQVFILVAILWPLFFVAFGVYDGRRNDTLRAELFNVASAIFAATMTLAGILYFTYRETPRVLFLIFVALDLLFLLGSRVLLWLHRRSHDGRAASRPAVLIVGAGSVGQQGAKHLRRFACADLDLVGYVDDDPAKRGCRFEGLPVLGTLDQVPGVVAEYKVHNALVALPLVAHERLVEICKTLQKLGVHVHVIPDLFALSFPSATLDGFGGIPVIDLGQPSIHGLRRGFKRTFDLLIACCILVLLSPVLAAIALAIRLDSPGPIIYRQQRIGENGRSFIMFKFRSMYANTDPRVHQAYVTRLIEENLSLSHVNGDIDGDGSAQRTLKMEDDPRITRVGGFLRKTSLDELPQLFNVLRGEMSLVGPRPPIPYEVDVYRDWHRRRLEAIPGVTGLWQVEARNLVSFDEMVRLDMQYIERQSLWLDLKILLQTPLAVIRGRGGG